MNAAEKKTRILIVDDSRLYRAHLRKLLQNEDDFEICGEAENGKLAVQLNRELKPDFILMDVVMPVMDGITAIRAILQDRAVPILVLTATGADGASADLRAFDALKAGALDVLAKPGAEESKEAATLAQDLPGKIRSLQRIRVFTHASPRANQTIQHPLFVLGASTGGPQALNTVLKLLPQEFPSSILIVQHISHGFLESLVKWLGRETPLTIEVAQESSRILPGHVYFAPTQRHLEIRNLRLALNNNPPQNGCRPAADVLFSSAAKEAIPTVGVILTGMGNDGAEGARNIHRLGGKILVQTPETCAVSGMPQAVIDAQITHTLLSLEGIAAEMTRLALNGLKKNY